MRSSRRSGTVSFYTYEVGAATPVQIAVSSPYTYNGTPMRRVPGTDDFITVTTNLSPSDFHLYRVDATGKAIYVNESPYHGDFAATVTYAFDGTPAAHLIQSQGLMLKIYGDGCTSTMNSFNTGCFIKDGVLGTLRTGESYLGLGDDAAGSVFAVVAASNSFDAPCKTGCGFQRIDVASHTITSQKQHSFTSSYYYPVMAAPDPRCANIIVGVATSTDPFATALAAVQALAPGSSSVAGESVCQTFALNDREISEADGSNVAERLILDISAIVENARRLPRNPRRPVEPDANHSPLLSSSD